MPLWTVTTYCDDEMKTQGGLLAGAGTISCCQGCTA